jgi:hypothetical protein
MAACGKYDWLGLPGAFLHGPENLVPKLLRGCAQSSRDQRSLKSEHADGEKTKYLQQKAELPAESVCAAKIERSEIVCERFIH